MEPKSSHTTSPGPTLGAPPRASPRSRRPLQQLLRLASSGHPDNSLVHCHLPRLAALLTRFQHLYREPLEKAGSPYTGIEFTTVEELQEWEYLLRERSALPIGLGNFGAEALTFADNLEGAATADFASDDLVIEFALATKLAWQIHS